MTFTRNASGTYFDANGLIQLALTNVPRFGYDPVTHAPRGLLIEDARTNLCLQSADFTSASWLRRMQRLQQERRTEWCNEPDRDSSLPTVSFGHSVSGNCTDSRHDIHTSCFFKAATQTTILMLIAGPAWNDADARSMTY